jgi:type IV secretory pathway VirB10-like protein
VAHAVSALYSKFNRMSPTAAALAALLHALVALAFLWESPRHEVETTERAIEFTVEPPTPTPSPTPPPTPEPAPAEAPAAAPKPAVQPAARTPVPHPTRRPDWDWHRHVP